MSWFYVKNGAQAGPVEKEELDRLAQVGEIQPETLVWMQGMDGWKPYREASVPAISSPSAPLSVQGTQAVCVECRNVFEKTEMIQHGEAYVCASCKPVFLQKLNEGVDVHATGMRYAGFWIRVAAQLLDGLLLFIVVSLPAMGIMALIVQAAKDSPALFIVQLFLQFIPTLIGIAYSIFFIGKYGATPGKMACQIKVVDASGAPIGYGRATGRYFAQILSAIICGIGYIMVAFDEEKRALHDRICDTRVVYK